MKHITRSKGQIIAAHTLTYFNFLNLFLAALIVTTGQVKNMLFLGVVLFNSCIGIVQEFKVKSLIDKLSVITATKARRIRGKEVEEIPVEEVQVGDKLAITIGDQLVADGTVLDCSGLEVNESLLTGESHSVLKKAGDLLYSGSHIVAGSGTMDVTSVGEDCYANTLVIKAKTKKRANSEMQRSIKRIIKWVSYAIVPAGILLYITQTRFHHLGYNQAIVGTVGGVIGMIPEGLVLLTSVSFILGVGRLAKKKALVQEMEAIEALARVNVLCCDKTGTITTGNLEVTHALALGNHSVDELNNDMKYISNAFTEENATSIALKKHYPNMGPNKIVDTLPFSSSRKYSGVEIENLGHFLFGAPDFISHDSFVIEQADTYASDGYRVLLLAKTDQLYSTPEEIKNIDPIGFVVLSDQIRPDAKDTFRFFKEQNVAIKVISGDNPATVSCIACRAELEGAKQYVDASTLPEDPEELSKVINNYTVFGRVTPEQKQKIILAFEQSGKITGMVGDGVNDVLAIKDADCGIAMAAGSDAAKQSAHIVLMDSDFSTMKGIVEEGRTIIANIERVSALYLTKTIYSFLLCIIFICLRKAYPFVPIQLTLISTTAIGIPSFFLTLERQYQVSTGGFLKHVLRISLPCALALVGGIIVVHCLTPILGLSRLFVSTLNLIIGGGISIAVVVFVCMPMNRRRFSLCLAITLLFCIGFLFFPGFFGIKQTFLAFY